jgi:hypothetical protein
VRIDASSSCPLRIGTAAAGGRRGMWCGPAAADSPAALGTRRGL